MMRLRNITLLRRQFYLLSGSARLMSGLHSAQPPVRANKQMRCELRSDNEGRNKVCEKPKGVKECETVDSQKQPNPEGTTQLRLGQYRTVLSIADYCTQSWLLHHCSYSRIDKNVNNNN